jgi:two-component system response regulator QseB
LVVEDEGVVSDVASRMLALIGHETRCVTTGAEALAELARGGYEAVLLDMTLPDGGSEAVIAAVPDGVQLVIMSGHRRGDLPIGDRAFLAKPFTLADLQRCFPCAS